MNWLTVANSFSDALHATSSHPLLFYVCLSFLSSFMNPLFLPPFIHKMMMMIISHHIIPWWSPHSFLHLFQKNYNNIFLPDVMFVASFHSSLMPNIRHPGMIWVIINIIITVRQHIWLENHWLNHYAIDDDCLLWRTDYLNTIHHLSNSFFSHPPFFPDF